MKKLALLLFISIIALALPVRAQQFAPAYLTAGPGYGDNSKLFGMVGYLRQTEVLGKDVTPFPYYRSLKIRLYRFPTIQELRTLDLQAIDTTWGYMFPFYNKRLLGFDVMIAVEGDGGLTSVPEKNSFGYTVGSMFLAKVTRPDWKWSLGISANPTKSSVGGVHADQVMVNLMYGFNGF